MESDYYTGLCALDEYSNTSLITLDLDLGNACRLELVLNVLSDLVIGYEIVYRDWSSDVCSSDLIP